MSDQEVEKGPNATYFENTTYGAKLSPLAKVKIFLRRFWWALVILFLLINLILVLCLLVSPVLPHVYPSFVGAARTELTICRVFAAFPSMAQQAVNKSWLEVKTITVTDPSNETVHMQQDAILHSSSIFTPTLDAFDASLFLENTEPNIKPFATLRLPKVHSTKSTPVGVDQKVTIQDMNQFIEYSKTIMNSETFRVAFRGKTQLHLGGLPVQNVDYNEVLTLKGRSFCRGP